MPTKQEYDIALYDLYSKFNHVLNSSSDENSATSLGRFKQFMNTNTVVKSIIENLTKDKNPVELDEFLFHPTNNLHFRIKEPQDIGVHILTMYSLIDEICSNEYKVSNLGAFLIPRVNSNKVVDGIRHFLEHAFTPLFSYLKNELEKGKVMVEDTSTQIVTVNQTIHGNSNTVTYSGRDSFINGQDFKDSKDDLNSLVEKALQELINVSIDEDEKEELADDLETLSTEINLEKPKKVKFRKIKKSIDSFLNVVDTTIDSIKLVETLGLIIEKLNALV